MFTFICQHVVDYFGRFVMLVKGTALCTVLQMGRLELCLPMLKLTGA